LPHNLFGAVVQRNHDLTAGDTLSGFHNSEATPTALSQLPATATQSGLVVNGNIFPIGSANVSGLGGGSILLGSLNIIRGQVDSDFSVALYGLHGYTITQSGTDLDFGTQAANGYTGAFQAGAVSFTVAAVPEPSSIILCAVAIASGVSYVALRRKNKIEAASVV
jgi:hypothetical protein